MLIDSELYLRDKGPFFDWPSNLLQDLTKVIYQIRAGHKHLLHLVVQPQVHAYEIHPHGSAFVAMRLLSERCSSTLKNVSIKCNSNLSPNHFANFLKKLTNLTHIDVSGSVVDDIGFEAIGLNGAHLVSLNANNTYITNVGVKRLCLDETQVFVSEYRCPKMTHLFVLETRVTHEGITLFIACHQNVVHIDHEETFHSLSLALRQRLHFQDDSGFRLTHLSSTSVTLSAEKFAESVERCPDVQSVTITSPGLGDEHLYKLMELKKLTTLHLGNKCSDWFSFYEGVAPVLDCCGPTLKALILEEFVEADIGFIGKSCPNLNHLALSLIDHYAPVLQINPKYFQKLGSFEIWNKASNRYTFCEMGLKQLMFNSPLQRFLLKQVGTFSDETMESVLQANRLLTLENVVLDHCENVTAKTAWKLLEQPNLMRILRIWDCKLVTKKDKDDLKKVIDEENLQLYFEWFPYNEVAEALANLDFEDDEE